MHQAKNRLPALKTCELKTDRGKVLIFKEHVKADEQETLHTKSQKYTLFFNTFSFPFL